MSVRIICGDVFDALAGLPDDSVDCCVTSPPYWGLRDYGVPGQIGLEPTLAEHIETIVCVFEEVRRVIKPTGVCWLNYGDCYATKPNGRSAAATKAAGGDDRTFRDKPFSTVGDGIKAKDLCLIPARLSIALCDAGWYVRSKVIWHKPNPMPESVRDRPATCYEEIFQLTKQPRYFWNKEAVKESVTGGAHARRSYKTPDGWDTSTCEGGHGSVHKKGRSKGKTAPTGSGIKNNESFSAAVTDLVATRNLRNVWTVAPKPFKEAHFATFPPKIVETCLKGGCPEGGLVLDPFGGAGTTALVAEQLGRNAILIELNPEYIDIAQQRIRRETGAEARVQYAATPDQQNLISEMLK